MTDQRISITPSPPRAGSSATVRYNFTGSGLQGTTLKVSYHIPGQPDTPPDEVPLTPSENSGTIEIPEGTTQITIEDENGNSPDLVIAVLPPLEIEGDAEG